MLPQERVARKRLIKTPQLTSSKFGVAPEKRSVEDLLDSGMVILDKPAGPTSHQVSAWARDILGLKKAGHGGTLDPRVTGLLPIALGSATNALRSLLYGGKEYVGVMRLHGDVPKKKIEEIFEEFTGKIYQFPPLRSAVKRELRVREVYYLLPMEIAKRLVLFRVGCKAGTYIRTLCHDMGDALGSGAHMSELRRTKIATFSENQAKTLHELKDAFVYWKEEGEESHIRDVIVPMERLLDHLPKIMIKDSAVDAVCHGANLAVPGIAQMDSGIKKGDFVAVISQKEEAVALGSALGTSEVLVDLKKGVAVNTERVLMSPGTYPKLWRSS
jgi:H/ACA ribonucleoprotein complex subunit 4